MDPWRNAWFWRDAQKVWKYASTTWHTLSMAENKSETKDELSKTRDVTDVHCEAQSQQHSIRL